MAQTLLYKRTHNGDPDKSGCFGVRDCMRGVRSRDFDSVIGVGGQGAESQREGVAEKINWIGIGAHKTKLRGMRNPVVTFDHFKDFSTEELYLCNVAPNLAVRMYVKKARIVMTFSPREQAEIDKLLKLANAAPPSPALNVDTAVTARCSSTAAKSTNRRGCRPMIC